jgi:molecular chaperone DnaK
MIQEAEANAEADKKQRELIDARNSAEHQLWGVEKSLKEHGDKLVDEQKEAIEAEVKKLREVISGDDAEAITKALEESIPKFLPLMEASQKAEAEKQTADAPTPSTETPKDDNVVDATFTEKKE